jgi:hypothetical protein
MYLFRETLISQDLLLLEYFLGETYFHLNNRLLVNNAALWPAIIQEKFLVVYLKCFSSFDITHESAEKVGVQISLFDLLKSLIFMRVSFIVLGVCIPYGSYSEYLYRSGCARINLDVGIL